MKTDIEKWYQLLKEQEEDFHISHSLIQNEIDIIWVHNSYFGVHRTFLVFNLDGDFEHSYCVVD